MLFYNQWATLKNHKDSIDIQLHLTVDDLKSIMSKSLEEIKRSATNSAATVLGNNPALCLSGGIDSQAMLSLWHKDFPYTAIFFEFDHGLNSEELADAKAYAEIYNIPYKIIKLDILRFLTKDLFDFAADYNISSPQFAVHSYFLKHLESLGYTGAAFGGNGLVIEESSVSFFLMSAQLLDLEKFSQKSKFPVIPSFLSFDQDLCLYLALNTPVIRETKLQQNYRSSQSTPILNSDNNIRYNNKIESYRNLLLSIRPQETKKTGFEQIKKYFNTVNDNQMAFENTFRMPLYVKNPNFRTNTLIDANVRNFIIGKRF